MSCIIVASLVFVALAQDGDPAPEAEVPRMETELAETVEEPEEPKNSEEPEESAEPDGGEEEAGDLPTRTPVPDKVTTDGPAENNNED
ncbi:MAG: hypothetical protein FWE69_03220, partial [Clostridiales bacterium]|nr:hypothetical protein [Clostridiales bacterium]